MKEIGGYFGLELPLFEDYFPNMIKYQSARAALRAVLEHVKADTLLLPAYICDAVVQAVVDAGVQPEFYSLDEDFFPKDLPIDSSGYYLLCVNYFGISDHNVSKLIEIWPQSQLIVDNSQALFSKPTDAIATIYSPRKFLGVPDGGLLYAPLLLMDEPDEEDDGSIRRTRHLLLRTAYSARTGYSDYLAAELTLQTTKPLAMSQFTRRIFRSFDLQEIKRKRKENFKIAFERLHHCNCIDLCLAPDTVPLCYPLMLFEKNITQIRQKMLRSNIFIPIYWQEVRNRIGLGSYENKLVNSTLFIPIDQRVSLQDINTICEILG